ncbi:MAG TPA: sulfotransferase, partial [candidate division Zixibacteria bacterium]|nr:sulfotransferase [candidate division Zixibacteria bacterium]
MLNIEPVKPVIIIGAPRTGTNILRDLITRLPRTATWDCDEINYIWRYGYRDYPTDEFKADFLTPKIADFIRKEFFKVFRKTRREIIVEKTCANTLRVLYIDKILPEAKYIFIVRDGRDAISSIRKQWLSKPGLSYIWQKAKYIPRKDIGYYASKYFLNLLHRFFSKKKSFSTWGPRFVGIDELYKSASLIKLSAVQWQRCTDNALRELSQIDKERVINIRYEDLVKEPVNQIERVAEFIGSYIESQ